MSEEDLARLPSEEEIAERILALRDRLETENPQELKELLREHVRRIVVEPTGAVYMDATPGSLLPERLYFYACREPDSNRHGPKPRGF